MDGTLVVIAVPTQSPGSPMMVSREGFPRANAIVLVLFTFNLCCPKGKLY